MEVDWVCVQKTSVVFDKASAILKPAEQEETEPPQTDLETVIIIIYPFSKWRIGP